MFGDQILKTQILHNPSIIMCERISSGALHSEKLISFRVILISVTKKTIFLFYFQSFYFPSSFSFAIKKMKKMC